MQHRDDVGIIVRLGIVVIGLVVIVVVIGIVVIVVIVVRIVIGLVVVIIVVIVVVVIVVVIGIVVGLAIRFGRLGRLLLGETVDPGHPLGRQQGVLAGHELDLEDGRVGPVDVGDARGPAPAGVPRHLRLEVDGECAVSLVDEARGLADRVVGRDLE